MRLPYLQLAEESWALARELAAILGCDRHRAMSLQVDLWKWALGLETDGQPSGQVLGKLAVARLAGAVEWDGDAAELAEALVEVGLLEVIEGGLRVRGLDRYAGAWRRQDADRQRKADFRARVSATRKESAPPTSAPRPQSVRRTSAGRPQDVRTESAKVRAIDVDVDVDVEKKQPPAPASPPPEPATPLVERVSEVFQEERGAAYSAAWSDEKAGRALLGKGSEDEILRRWRIGLRARFPACHSLADLLRNWNAYAKEAPDGTASARTVALQRAAGADIPCPCGKPGERDSYGVWMCAACADKSDAHWRAEGVSAGAM